MSFLEPTPEGHYLCPYCSELLTAILREWMKIPAIDYVCHNCQKIFVIKRKNSLEKWI